MAFPTIALGLLPDYATIGLAAPILLIVIRLIQGLSVGGEFSSSVTYMVEMAAEDRQAKQVHGLCGQHVGNAACFGRRSLGDDYLFRCFPEVVRLAPALFVWWGARTDSNSFAPRLTDFAPFSRPRSGDTVTVSLQAVVAGKQG